MDGGKEEGKVRLSMDSRREVIIKAASEYRRSPKKDKSRVLDTITDVAGYNRDYASHLLSLFEKRVYLEGRNGVRYILEPDRSNKQIKRNRERRYDNDVLTRSSQLCLSPPPS